MHDIQAEHGPLKSPRPQQPNNNDGWKILKHKNLRNWLVLDFFRFDTTHVFSDQFESDWTLALTVQRHPNYTESPGIGFCESRAREPLAVGRSVFGPRTNAQGTRLLFV